jgi:KUP system potassium uptake protein
MSETPRQQTVATADATGRRLLVLSVAALGVVYGDIGTSPLYAIRECFHGEYGITPTPANILGVLSLMFWSLLLIVSVKYLSFIMQADNHGEGGVIALTALLRPHGRRPLGSRWFLLAMGLFAASLLYGDGMITPAISVLSAVEGLRTITPVLQPYIVPITMVILIGLFVLQRRGTGQVGVLFGPITLLWLITIGILGLMSLWRRPGIVIAVSPIYGMRFLWHNHLHGFLVLGAVFLVVTGTEALYADMGHFGKRPIRLCCRRCF